MQHFRAFAFGFVSILNLTSLPALAWGDTGHRVVGEIAQSRLNAHARKKLKEILGDESLARAATWPDEVRSDPEHYGDSVYWHFMQIPEGKAWAEVAHPAEGDIYTALVKLEGVLQGRGTPKEKREAVRFVAHFIGDLHQPLHVGNGTDQGGNWCTVSWMNKPVNLHSVWDSEMINDLKLSFTEYTRFLNDALDSVREKSYASGVYADWLVESSGYLAQVYPVVRVDEQAVAGHPYCRDPKMGPPEPALVPQIGYGYAFANRALLDQRLTQAGIRLAYALNQIFDGKSLAGR